MLLAVTYLLLMIKLSYYFSPFRAVEAFQQLQPTTQPPLGRSRFSSSASLQMGIFDGISKAFANQDFTEQDQRVRASHILIKGDDPDVVLPKVMSLLQEIGSQSAGDATNVPQVFAQIARRESQCPSAAKGGDLGIFSPKQMVPEFDEAVFGGDTPPPAGTVVGPVVTDFGAHIIYITQRFDNKDQVEEKLARIDPDAQM